MHPAQISGLRETVSWLPSPDCGPRAAWYLPRSPAPWSPHRQWRDKKRSKRNWGRFAQYTANLNWHPWSWHFEGQLGEPKKKFSTWRRKGSRRNSVLPAGKSLPISSSLRQGWIRVWTSISTAVRFPKKTTDKNIIWILDRFGKVSALLKKKYFGNCNRLNSAPTCLPPLKGESAFSLQPILWISILPGRAGLRVLFSFGVPRLLTGNLIFQTSK